MYVVKLRISPALFADVAFAALAYLWNVDTGPEELQVLPHLLGFEFGVQDGQLCEHTHVGTLQSQCSLQHSDQLLKVTTILKGIQTYFIKLNLRL